MKHQGKVTMRSRVKQAVRITVWIIICSLVFYLISAKSSNSPTLEVISTIMYMKGEVVEATGTAADLAKTEGNLDNPDINYSSLALNLKIKTANGLYKVRVFPTKDNAMLRLALGISKNPKVEFEVMRNGRYHFINNEGVLHANRIRTMTTLKKGG